MGAIMKSLAQIKNTRAKQEDNNVKNYGVAMATKHHHLVLNNEQMGERFGSD